VSRATRIEVVTEGIFSRQISRRSRTFRESPLSCSTSFTNARSMADLGPGTGARRAGGKLREDLRILVMSATLDGARVAKLLGDAARSSRARDAPLRWRPAIFGPQNPMRPLERQNGRIAIASALRADPGSVLAFLPGAAEIRRTQNFLGERIHDAGIEIVPLFGALDAAVQDRAIRAAAEGIRKVVLANLDRGDLADHRGRSAIVVRLRRGAGCRAMRPTSGLTRLETVRASRAAVESAPRPRRPHRAPASATGCGTSGKTASLAAYTQPEILSADLSSLVLDLAQWGVSDPAHGWRFWIRRRRRR